MSQNRGRIYQFGQFQINVDEHLLLHNGRPVRVPPKTFDLLLFFVRRSNQMIDKEILIREIWPDAFIEESNLTVHISRLRKILAADSEKDVCIENFSKRGYRFVADVLEFELNETQNAGVGKAEVGSKPYPSRPALNYEQKQPVISIVVLPFENGSDDENLEYLADGLTETLIDLLSQLPQLRVIARHSAFKYKGKEIELQEIERALGVQAAVTGRVTQSADNLIVRAELLAPANNSQIWGNQYVRRIADLQSVQEEIVRSVSEKLRLKLTGEQEQKITKHDTQNSEAFQLYLNGQYYSASGGIENILKAIDYCYKAISLDPNFALPYAALGKHYIILVNVGAMNPKEALPKARWAADKASELNESLTEARLLQAILKQIEWNWEEAALQFQKALESNPNSAPAREHYAYFLKLTGRYAEALIEIRKAQELDPFRVWLKYSESKVFGATRRYDEALTLSHEVAEIEPKLTSNIFYLGYLYTLKQMYPEAIKAFQKFVSLEAKNLHALPYFGCALAKAGKRGEALAVLDKLNSSQDCVSPAELAVLYLGMGDKKKALELLQKAFEERDMCMQYLNSDPFYDDLRLDPHFQEIVRKVGLPLIN